MVNGFHVVIEEDEDGMFVGEIPHLRACYTQATTVDQLLQNIREVIELEAIVSNDEEIMQGAPVFAGTRVPVQSLLDHLEAGDSLADFLDGFPSVSYSQAKAIAQLFNYRQIVLTDLT